MSPKHRDDRDDASFLDAMNELGVKPYAGSRRIAGRAASGKRSAPAAADRSKPVADVPGERRPQPEAAGDERASEAAEALAYSEEARRELEATRDRLAAERDEAAARCTKLATERDRLATERGELRRRLATLEAAMANRRTLRDALMDRGCADAREALEVLQGLLAVCADELIDAIELAAPDEVKRLLERRVAIVEAGRPFEPKSECAVLRVTADRCEIAGGSDIRAQFREFHRACIDAGLRRVTIVGGSPNYRNELKNLAEPHRKELRIDLMSGTVQKSRRRAESNVRASELVIIWGATELDHSVSEVYTQEKAKLLRIPHRGISLMLRHAAEHIEQRGQDQIRPGKARGERGKKRR